jgi:hypothetical protein
MTRYASGVDGLPVPALEAAQRALSRLRADL